MFVLHMAALVCLQDALRTWRSMVPHLTAHGDGFVLNVFAFCPGLPQDASLTSDVEFANWLSDLMLVVSKLVGTCAFIDAELGKGDVVTKECVVQPALKQAFGAAAALAAKAAELSELPAAGSKTPASLQSALLVDLAAMTGWLQSLRAALRQAGRRLWQHVVARARSLATEAEAVTPRYGHLITKSKLQSAMLKKVMLASSTRARLSELTVGLHKLLGAAAELQAQYGGDDNDVESVDITGPEAIFTAAKDACTVTAACAILFEKTGPDQKSERDRFLSRGRLEIGEPLLAALRAL